MGTRHACILSMLKDVSSLPFHGLGFTCVDDLLKGHQTVYSIVSGYVCCKNPTIQKRIVFFNLVIKETIGWFIFPREFKLRRLSPCWTFGLLLTLEAINPFSPSISWFLDLDSSTVHNLITNEKPKNRNKSGYENSRPTRRSWAMNLKHHWGTFNVTYH